MDCIEYINQLLLKIKLAQDELCSIENKLSKRSFLKRIIDSGVDASQKQHQISLISNWQTDIIIAARKHLFTFDPEYTKLANENMELLSGSIFRLDFTNDFSSFYDFLAGPAVLAQRSPGTAGYFEGVLTVDKISFKSKTLKSGESNALIGIATQMEGYVNYLGHTFLKPVEAKKHLRPSYYEAKIDGNGKIGVKSVEDTLLPMHPYGFNILNGNIFKNNPENGIKFFKNIDKLHEIIDIFKKSNNINF